MQSFRDVLVRHTPEVGDDVMTYAQELLEEGRTEGKLQYQVEVIENLLREGLDWSVIERTTGVSEAQFDALKQRVAEMNT